MLPSDELKELSESVDINLSGKTSPKGCDIRYRQFYWMMVFNGEGELAAAYNLSDELTTRMKTLKLTVPQAMVSAVESGLRVEHSLEDLERRYVAERGSEASYLALRQKIDAMAGVGQMRLAEFLKSSSGETADPGLSHARGILVAANACGRQVINHTAFAALRNSIEEFMIHRPTHPSSRDLIEPLVGVALKYTFDLSAKCEAYAREWTRAGVPEEAKASLGGLSKQLLDLCAADLARAEQSLRADPTAYGADRLRARLGQAEETLKGLDTGTTFGVFKPIHAEWRVEATSKLKDR